MWELSFQNHNQIVNKDFWMARIEPYFHKSLEFLCFLDFQKLNSQVHIFGTSTWAPIDVNFITFG